MLDTPYGFSRRDAAKLTGWLILILLGCGLVLGFIIGLATGISKTLNLPLPVWVSVNNPVFEIVTNTATFALGLLIGLRQAKAKWMELFVGRRSTPAVYALILFTLLGFVILQSEINNVTHWAAPPPQFLYKIFSPLFDLATHPIAAPVALLIMAPITEEFFFRGFILRRLLAVRPASQAIWTSALLFMVFHLNPWQFPVALFCGLLTGWLYARTRSLGLCLTAHAFINGTSLLSAGLSFHVRGFNIPHAAGRLVFQPWWFDLLGLLILAAGLYGLSRLTPPLPERPIVAEPPPLPEPVVEVR